MDVHFSRRPLGVGSRASRRFVWALILMLPGPALADTPTMDGPAPSSPSAAAEIPAVYVIATRAGLPLDELPQRVDVVDGAALADAPGLDLADALKRATPLDIVQYPGLSGVGLRGMAPDFSSYTKSTAILLDGRPAGTPTLSDLPVDGVDRVELLKGPASALYGAEAMGGVINVVTRRSRGVPAGRLRVGAGSFGAWRASLSGGGSLTPRLDFDAGAVLDAQEGDSLAGGRVPVPDSDARMDSLRLRLGTRLGDRWRLELSGNGTLGRAGLSQDQASPYAVADPGWLETARWGGSATLRDGGDEGGFRLTVYAADDRSTGHLDAGVLEGTRRYYKAYEGELGTFGAQAGQAWRCGGQELRLDLEHKAIQDLHRAWSPPAQPGSEGDPAAPFNPDGGQTTDAASVQMGLSAWGRRVTGNLGGRYDRIVTELRRTAYRDDVAPSAATLDRFSPSVGLQIRPWSWLKLHGSAGAAFVPPEASKLGLDATLFGVRYLGNPDLRPVSSRGADAGLGIAGARGTFSLDATAHWTVLEGNIVTRAVEGASIPTYTYVNLPGDTEIAGWELEATADLAAAMGWRGALRLRGNWSHLLRARAAGSQAADSRPVTIMNVDQDKAVFGLEAGVGALAVGVFGRHRGAVLDLDYDAPTYPYPEILYPTVWILDVDVTVRTGTERSIHLLVSNLADTFYFEKKGYPRAGRAFRMDYTIGF